MIADQFSSLVNKRCDACDGVKDGDIPLRNKCLPVTPKRHPRLLSESGVTPWCDNNRDQNHVESTAYAVRHTVTPSTPKKHPVGKKKSDQKVLTPAKVLAVFQSRGFTLSIGKDGHVEAQGPRPLTEKERGVLEQYKDGLAGELRQAPAQDAADRHEAYLERCAIMQYDGNMTRREAERRAGTCYYCRHWQGTKSGRGWCVQVRPPVQRQADDTCERFKV